MKDFLIALAPSVGVLIIFWIGIKSLVEADRRERVAAARLEGRSEGQIQGQAPTSPQPASPGRGGATAPDAAPDQASS